MLSEGYLYAYDSQIDTTTGTLKLRAEFKNENNNLFPNQFVNARILIDMLDKALIVPTVAIQYGSKGSFVFALKPDNTVTIKPVKVRASFEDMTAVAGVNINEKVITEGTDKLTEGTLVRFGESYNNNNNDNQNNKYENIKNENVKNEENNHYGNHYDNNKLTSGEKNNS